MKKNIFTILIGLTLLGGCQNTVPKAAEKEKPTEAQQQPVDSVKDASFPYQSLLSEDEQSYTLLVIGEIDEQNPIEENEEIMEAVSNILSLPKLETAQKAYPELDLEGETVYLLFDNQGIVFEGKELKELTTFLEK
ncbi:hypothetical protein [Bacillus sp. MRMR6]|uniref:hypothetical protein n=1 Tax=Bacillus sp. MRMR6 TaxID=1928617 RepID=UPI0009510F67|nr:hypothetical protein [Bacillus sp. MRMR6]OLS36856.1 hypothetical protein BTR25_16825 [Bacillus sp. MRMR6]